ncbi:hypothetical protein SS50377_28666 [Spironucleus salmonicida]|uniref:Uncharacterized protein n=1 Tax=Spironucleus salmonicida TaxID=348837 RepID=V6LAS3_9EUKA|nr:hypothetical protein SS50377_28666 [Spironucleus salmonicida]|eukprot:EST41512.1 Hypothetical protein SS50377_fx005 [Spironucleus salmonicida]
MRMARISLRGVRCWCPLGVSAAQAIQGSTHHVPCMRPVVYHHFYMGRENSANTCQTPSPTTRRKAAWVPRVSTCQFRIRSSSGALGPPHARGGGKFIKTFRTHPTCELVLPILRRCVLKKYEINFCPHHARNPGVIWDMEFSAASCHIRSHFHPARDARTVTSLEHFLPMTLAQRRAVPFNSRPPVFVSGSIHQGRCRVPPRGLTGYEMHTSGFPVLCSWKVPYAKNPILYSYPARQIEWEVFYGFMTRGRTRAYGMVLKDMVTGRSDTGGLCVDKCTDSCSGISATLTVFPLGKCTSDEALHAPARQQYAARSDIQRPATSPCFPEPSA